MRVAVALLYCVSLVACGGSGDASSDGGRDGGHDAGSDAAHVDAGSSGPPGALPEGDVGIASRHLGDVGIGSDSDVIFADDFESYGDASEVTTKWTDAYHDLRISTESGLVHGGSQALEFANPQGPDELSNTVAYTIPTELDVLFLRYYSRYDPAFDVVGSSHNGGGISAHYFIGGMATPGVPADGTNKYLIEYEAWRGMDSDASPGSLNTYVYHPEQRSMYGDHFFPDGTVTPYSPTPFDFGPTFVSRPQVTPDLGRWYCYEVMLQANTVGARDGRIALWLDGALLADFQNLRFRDVASLKIDRFNLSLHTHANPSGVTYKWYDDVVAARSYIGPMH